MTLSEKDNRRIMLWLFVVCGLILFMISLGGYVRLTRSGLSIVEWNPVSGVVPPVGEKAWQEEFAKYQETPEFQKINSTMTLEGYKRIFYVEYIHRLLARFAGLAVLFPLLYFLFKGIIPWRRSAIYIAIVVLFAFQGFLGWYMVSSGLEDVPHVNHFRLTIHLLMAMFLLALTLWRALHHRYHFPQRLPGVFRSGPFILMMLTTAVLIVQISYGGFVAGLKAGWVSNTWPLMFGRLVPSEMFSTLTPRWLNLLEAPATVHFIHRWLAFVVLAMTFIVLWQTRQRPSSATIKKAVALLFLLTCTQILLGIGVVLFSVPMVLALSHQAVAMLMFVVVIFINYQVVYDPVVAPVVEAADLPATAVGD